MRAAVFKEVGKPLVVETFDDPKPGPRDLILKVRACGICGSDLHMSEAGTMMPLPSGAVMGHEFSGEVVAIGSALKGEWREGARVAGFPYLCCGDMSDDIDAAPTPIPEGSAPRGGRYAPARRWPGRG